MVKSRLKVTSRWLSACRAQLDSLAIKDDLKSKLSKPFIVLDIESTRIRKVQFQLKYCFSLGNVATAMAIPVSTMRGPKWYTRL